MTPTLTEIRQREGAATLVEGVATRAAIYATEVERLRQALEQTEQHIADAEPSLRIWDVSLSSEYWLRWDPTIRAASAAIGETGGE